MTGKLSLVDELTQKNAPKFQVSKIDDVIDIGFINETLANNNEGILNLSSNINEVWSEKLVKSIKLSNPNYLFELKYDVTNYEIMFKKKEVQN